MTLAFAASLLASSVAVAGDGFLGPEYPVEADVSYVAGLFHWVDSIATTSGGKTIPAHIGEYVRRWGKPTPADHALLVGFGKARFAHAAAKGPSGLLEIFCAAPSVDRALAAARVDLPPSEGDALAAALSAFAPKFDAIWDGGAVPRAFAARVASAPRRTELAGLLSRIAGFYGVDPKTVPRPRLVLVPVPGGWGTHAEAAGRQLLIEIQPGDELADQAAVIVHENAHFLFKAISGSRRARLGSFAKSLHGTGEAAWSTLGEALPTALGQGVADRIFRPSGWSRRAPWYHIPDVDEYAKRLHAPVNHALANSGALDEEFLRVALQIWVDRALRRPSAVQDLGAGGS